MRRISEKQKAELSLRKKIKAELMQEQLEKVGYIYCVQCRGKPDFRGIQLRHKVALSKGGKTELGNVELWCGKCHSKNHGIHEAEELKTYWD